MKNRIIIDLADHMSDIIDSQPHILSTRFKDENEEIQYINVLDDNMFRSYFEYFFYSYSMISFKELTDNEIIFRFNNMWRIFQMEEKENLEKIVQGYYWDYVPVYNYDRTEHWTDIKTGSEDDEYGEKENNEKTTGSYKDVTTPEGKTIVTNAPEGSYKDESYNADLITKNDVSTMDSQNYRSKDKTTTDSHTDYVERTYNEYQEMTTTEYEDAKSTSERTYNNHNIQRIDNEHTDTHTYNEVTDTHEGRMFGNIGVTTNVQMIEGEFGLRIHNLGYEWIKKFFDKYFVML